MKQHYPNGTCCEPRQVRLQHGLFDRLRARGHSDEYCRRVGALSGCVVTAEHTFEGLPGLVYAYALRSDDGYRFHLSALYADPIEEAA